MRYQATVGRTWSSNTHPGDFPLLAHFSPVIGRTHDCRYSPFHAGSAASPGLEMLCEEGKHQPLDAAIRSAIAAGTAGALIETPDPTRDSRGSATFNVAGHAKPNRLQRNDGDLQFTDITSPATASIQNTFTSIFVDLDGDRYQDWVLAQNTGEVETVRNRRDGSFEAVPLVSGYGC